MIGSNPQKISKPLTRPTSGQQKRPPSGTNPSKMEVLAPEKSTTATVDYSKPQLLPKKGPLLLIESLFKPFQR